MNKFVTAAVALVASAALSSLAVAQHERPSPEKAPPDQMVGKVAGKITSLDPTAKTFVASVQGRDVSFFGAKLAKLPAVGDAIEVTFTLNPLQPDGLPIATATAPVDASKVDATATRMFMGGTSRAPARCVGGPVGGGYCHCHKSYYGPFQSLNVCSGG